MSLIFRRFLFGTGKRSILKSSKASILPLKLRDPRNPFQQLDKPSLERPPVVVAPKRRTKIGSADQEADSVFAIPDIQVRPLLDFNAKKSKVRAFCTAEAYSMQNVKRAISENYISLPLQAADDIFHVRLQSPSADLDQWVPEAFIFANGSVVSWGASDDANNNLLRLLKPLEINAYSEVETEWYDYTVDSSQYDLRDLIFARAGGLYGETIMIGKDLSRAESKLVKLGALETRLDHHLDKNRNIPEILLQGKRLPIDRSAILRNLGELFSLRGHVNLHSELLDSPDFCWTSAKMEDFFNQVCGITTPA
ncbi:MAG: hypothetical protein SGCHY_000708 [Lobulomycetales sp.]